MYYLSSQQERVQFCHVRIPSNEHADALASMRWESPHYPQPTYPAFHTFQPLTTTPISKLSTITVGNLSGQVWPDNQSISPWLAPYHRNRHRETTLAHWQIDHTCLLHLHHTPTQPCTPHATFIFQSNVSYYPASALLKLVPSFYLTSSLLRYPNLLDILTESPTFSVSNLFSFFRWSNYPLSLMLPLLSIPILPHLLPFSLPFISIPSYSVIWPLYMSYIYVIWPKTFCSNKELS